VSSSEGGASGPSAPLSKEAETKETEHGFSLAEVILASALLLVVLLPSAALLQSSDSALSLSRAKVVAANLAAGQLEVDRATADNLSTWAPDTSPCDSSVWAPCLSAPTSPVNVPSGGESYAVVQTSGWCAESPSTGAWANYSSTNSYDPPAYRVRVTVSWLGGSQGVSASETLTTPMSATPPSSGTCPA